MHTAMLVLAAVLCPSEMHGVVQAAAGQRPALGRGLQLAMR